MQKMCPRQMEATSLNRSGCQKRRLCLVVCRKYWEKERCTRRMFTSKWEKLQGQRVPSGGAPDVSDDGVENWGMNASLENPQALLSFSLGTWKVSRECRTWNKPFPFPHPNLFADLTLSQLTRYKPRLAFLSFPQSQCHTPYRTWSGVPSACCFGGLCLALLWHCPLVWGLSILWMFAWPLDDRPLEDRNFVLFIISLQVLIMWLTQYGNSLPLWWVNCFFTGSQ